MFQGDASLIMQEKEGITKRRNASRYEREWNQNLSEMMRKDPSSTHSREDEHKLHRCGGREQKKVLI